MKSNEYLTELQLALGEYRFNDVRALTDQMEPASFELSQIKKTLGFIRRKRLFSELEHAAGIFSMTDDTAPFIRRQYCQSLLDQGRVSQALAILDSLSKGFSADPAEGPEIRGLIGRAFKQLYIDRGGEEHLRSAISAYLTDWESRSGDYRWQGINLVALVSRANRDGVDPGCAIDPVQIAHTILDDIDERGASGVWDYATAMEASVALGDETTAFAWAKQYVQHPGADAFEIGATLRQFKEVWSLEGTGVGDKLLPVLECALLQREGGSVQPIRLGRAVDPAGFEAVWGSEGYTYLEWFDSLRSRCNAVARISDASTGKAEGTGFLLSGSHLYPAWGDSPVFLTNAHVISADPLDEAPLHPTDAVAEFTRLAGRPKVAIGKTLFTSPRSQLDVVVSRIQAPQGALTLEPSLYLPKVSSDSEDPQRIYVIGHPAGNELAVSMYDNNLVEYADQFVRYRSPTEGGHSGSPVFTRQLKPFAVHHRALYDRQVNEGILLNAIRTALAGSAD